MSDRPSRQAIAIMGTVNRYDFKKNLAPEALFSFAIGTLTIWCTPEDNPGGLWQQVAMIPVQGTKPVEPVAHCSLLRYEHAEDLAALSLQTKAYTLFSVGLISEAEIENRPDDIAWAKRKLEWLWQQALPGEPMPPIVVEWDRDKPKEDYSDFF